MNREQVRSYQEALDREAAAKRLERERRNLTVRKAVIVKAVCNNCQHNWPYMEGDEDKPCPACNGGAGRSWTSRPNRGMV